MKPQVLCPIDYKHESLAAEAVAYNLAKALKAGVTFLSVEEGYQKLIETVGISLISTKMPALRERLLGEAAKHLATHVSLLSKKLELSEAPPHSAKVESGHAAEGILALVDDKASAVELVVLAKRRRNFLHDFFLGSVAQVVLDNSKVPVLCVPDHPQYTKWTPKNVFFATDLQKSDVDGINVACGIAKLFDGQVKIVHVVEPFQSIVSPEVPADLYYHDEIESLREEHCKKMLKEEEARCDLERERVSSELFIGSPTEELSRLMTSQSNALLVVETHRRRHNVGRLAHAIARSAAFPVLFVPEASSLKSSL